MREAAGLRIEPAAVGAGLRIVYVAAGTTTTVTTADCDAFCAFLPTTWNVPVTRGAVYVPSLVIVPPAAPSWTLQLMTPPPRTPATVPANDCTPPGRTST